MLEANVRLNKFKPQCQKGYKHKTSGPRSTAKRRRRYVDDESYILVKLDPDDPLFSMTNSGGYVFEHRLVMARFLGRCLSDDEEVHHKNGVKDDNRLENLELLDGSTHQQIHKLLYHRRKVAELEASLHSLGLDA